jgi:hypothetical protein
MDGQAMGTVKSGAAPFIGVVEEILRNLRARGDDVVRAECLVVIAEGRAPGVVGADS